LNENSCFPAIRVQIELWRECTTRLKSEISDSKTNDRVPVRSVFVYRRGFSKGLEDGPCECFGREIISPFVPTERRRRRVSSDDPSGRFNEIIGRSEERFCFFFLFAKIRLSVSYVTRNYFRCSSTAAASIELAGDVSIKLVAHPPSVSRTKLNRRPFYYHRASSYFSTFFSPTRNGRRMSGAIHSPRNYTRNFSL